MDLNGNHFINSLFLVHVIIDLIYYFTYFSTVFPSNSCVFLSCRPFVVNTFLTGLVGETEETSTPTRPVENVVLTNEMPTGKKHTTVGWDDGGKIVKIINKF